MRRAKLGLFAALKSHGSAESKLICESVPTKPEDSIKSYIRRLKRMQDLVPAQQTPEVSNGPGGGGGGLGEIPMKAPRAAKMVRREARAPIENWVRMMEGDIDYNVLTKDEVDKNVSSAVPSMLSLIAKYERHPIINEDNKVDYAAIYESLAQLMRGEVPKDLNAETSAKILNMLTDLLLSFKAAKDNPTAAEGKEMMSKYRQLDMKPSGGSVEEEEWEAAAAMTGANPFRLPMRLFQKHVKEGGEKDLAAAAAAAAQK
jgi:hypothetical protein